MTKESVRKCSHCGHNGHNLRTCYGKGCFKLFGVKIDLNAKEDESSVRKDDSIRKSKSMGNLQACNNENGVVDAGYLSDGFIQSERAKASHERKKGVPWTEDEHLSFLVGLKKLGKGDWRGISKNFVPSRTPTQVASHAQKYFIRMAATERKKRRSSLFDMPLKETNPHPQASSPGSPSNKASEISQQVSNSLVAPLKNTSNIQGLVSSSAHGATSEKPPLSPVARTYGIPDFLHMPYMVGFPSNGQSFPATKVMPAVSFVPVMNFPNNTSYVYLPNSNGNFATCAPFMYQSSSDLLPLQHHAHGPSQAGPASSVTKKDGLEASIGALSI